MINERARILDRLEELEIKRRKLEEEIRCLYLQREAIMDEVNNLVEQEEQLAFQEASGY